MIGRQFGTGMMMFLSWRGFGFNCSLTQRGTFGPERVKIPLTNNEVEEFFFFPVGAPETSVVNCCKQYTLFRARDFFPAKPAVGLIVQMTKAPSERCRTALLRGLYFMNLAFSTVNNTMTVIGTISALFFFFIV